MLPALISALRAVVEMVGLCLLGQGVLALIAGAGRQRNPIYRLFDLITRPPRGAVRACLPATLSEGAVAATTFAVLFFLWVLLALMRKMI